MIELIANMKIGGLLYLRNTTSKGFNIKTYQMLARY